MKSKFPVFPVLLLWGACLGTAAAEETLRDGARSAGRAVGGVIHDVGQGAKKVGKEVGTAAREGGRELKKAVKGEK